MKNKRGFGDRVIVVAAATRTSGQAVVEQGFHGFAETDAASGARYALDISQTEHEIAFIASSTKGDVVVINETTNVLTRIARGGTVSGGSRIFGIISAVPGDGISSDATIEPKTGKMWVILASQI